MKSATALIVGIFGIAASNYFYYLAIQRTRVATAIILQYLAPVFVLLWMLFRKLQPPTFSRIGGVLVAVLGSVLAIGVVSRAHGFPWLAIVPGQIRFDLIGVIAALIAAVASPSTTSLAATSFSLTTAGPCLPGRLAVLRSAGFSSIRHGGSLPLTTRRPQWAFMALFSITSILVPFSLYFAGLHHLDATRAIVTSCLQPVFSILIAALALGELVGRIQIAGILLVLASTILVQLERNRTEARRPASQWNELRRDHHTAACFSERVPQPEVSLRPHHILADLFFQRFDVGKLFLLAQPVQKAQADRRVG